MSSSSSSGTVAVGWVVGDGVGSDVVGIEVGVCVGVCVVGDGVVGTAVGDDVGTEVVASGPVVVAPPEGSKVGVPVGFSVATGAQRFSNVPSVTTHTSVMKINSSSVGAADEFVVGNLAFSTEQQSASLLPPCPSQRQAKSLKTLC